MEQKKITAKMTARKKGEWEKKKIEETKRDGKRFWEMIRELLGENNEREEETYVYTKDGVRKEIMEMKEEYVEAWKNNSFQ